MKTSHKFLSGTLALAMLAIVPTASVVSAYQGDPAVEGPDCTPEMHDLVEEAFATNDYAAWAELMDGKGRIAEVVTADNFALFAEAHSLAETGDLEGAKAIRTELGLGLKNGQGQGQGDSDGEGEKQGEGNKGQGQNK